MEGEQKEHVIKGTVFLFDVEREALVEKGKPDNIMLFNNMTYNGSCYSIDYSTELKNEPDVFSMKVATVPIDIPQMKEIDPEGMARKYGLKVGDLEGKTDFHVVVDQKLYRERLNLILPILDVMGHPFYMYIRERRLQPKDNFLSEGISYKAIDYNETPDGKLWLFYDKVNQCNVELDIDSLTKIPKHIFVLELPTERQLDPVGWAWKNGFDVEKILMDVRPQRKMEAKVVPWSETRIPEVIKKNLEKIKSEKQSTGPGQKPKKKRGKGL